MPFTSNKIQLILKYQLFILVGIFAILEGFLGYNLYKIINQQQKSNKAEVIMASKCNNTTVDINYKKIDGSIANKDDKNLWPVAVMIDNHFDAWPNYGLSQANIVYETLVEGNFTRFMALYTPQKNNEKIIAKIGPIRSARPYFLKIAKEFDALYAHSGGSPQALQEIEELNINNLEEIAWWGPDYFWRVYSRQAPHNLFTSSNNLAQAVIDWELNKNIPIYKTWKFNDYLEKNNYPEINNIKINFSMDNDYDAIYKYNTTTETYFRWQGKQKHIDALTNQQIEVKNVIIQFVPKKKILDQEGRIELKLIGTGKTLIFRNGKEIVGKWKKRNAEARTIFYDKNNNEIEFKRGNIWVEIVPVDKKVEVE